MDPLTIAVATGIAYAVSGAARKMSAEGRFNSAHTEYESLIVELKAAENSQTSVVGRLADLSTVGVRNVVKAEKLLSPLRAKWFRNPLHFTWSNRSAAELALRKSRNMSLSFTAATSIATGAATAGAIWLGTQAVGIASTGLPIVFLHGAALHNASLAFLGGGALAKGGGGMLFGGAVLAAAVVLPASAVFGWKSHGMANEINEATTALHKANKSNSSLLKITRDSNASLEDFERALTAETETFERMVSRIKRRLLRFGFFSHLFRLLRARLWSTYYLAGDMTYVDELSAATVQYTTFVEDLRQGFSSRS